MARTFGAYGKNNKLYALYDKDENLAFVGTSQECIQYMGCTLGAFYQAMREGRKAMRLYTIIGMESDEVL